MIYKVDYISTGKVKNVLFEDKTTKKTGVYKEPFLDSMYLTTLGFQEDEQQYKGHGGPEKAICLYSKDNYEIWKDLIPKLPKYALFGENLTVSQLREEDLNIGDQYRLGEAIIQVSCLRQPCATIAKRYNLPTLVKKMSQNGRTGCYFRVLKEGTVKQGDNLELLSKYEPSLSIAEMNETLYNDRHNKERIQRILEHPSINDETRKIFSKLIK